MLFKFNTQKAITHSSYLVGSHSKILLPVPLLLSESSGEKEYRSAIVVKWRQGNRVSSRAVLHNQHTPSL